MSNRKPREILLDDIVLPFRIEGMDVRGRLVRLGPLAQKVLSQHAYPEPVSRLLGEALALTGLLGSNMKHDGIFTVQASGDGPLGMFVADYATPGNLRGYAGFREDDLPKDGDPGLEALMGNGHFAMTLDQGGEEKRYQGIVALTGDTLSDCAAHYFRHSEQIPTRLLLSAARVGGQWRAGGLILQHLPPDDEAGDRAGEGDPDDWNRASLLAGSATPEELIDPSITPEQLLLRLFHEDGVRVFDTARLQFRCRCSAARIRNVLASLTRAEIEESVVNGRIEVTCDFCSEQYEFDPDEFRR